jgi:hypothetical protein
MSSTGYIKNGVYYRAEKVPIDKLVIPQQSMFKQGDHARQRFDHSAEILQPYDHNGKPNPKFIEASPEAAEDYGFLPRTTPLPVIEPAHGSIPWGQVNP